MMSHTGTQTIIINILLHISKGNQAIKFGQLRENNVRNIFPQKS